MTAASHWARIAIAVVCVVCACAAPKRAVFQAREDGKAVAQAAPASAPAATKPAPRRASGLVIVRLASLEGALEIDARDSAGRHHKLRRSKNGLVVDGASSAELLLTSDSGASVEVGGARYAGRVRVRVATSGEWWIENEVDLEDYVAGVVAKELGFGEVPREAWRAQAIAARSYALAALEERGARRSDPYLFDSVRDQAYGGRPQPRNAKERASVESLLEAVQSTRGLVLTERGECVDARYHASCGGRTANGRDVFPELRATSLQSVACAPCARDASAAWTWTASAEQLRDFAHKLAVGERVTRITPTRVDASERWLEVELQGDRASRRLRFEELRRAFGPDKLRSARIVDTWPKVGAEISGGLLFRGAGFGHGAGLCQRGARARAREGWSAERILAHYYSGARIEDRR